MAQRRSDSTLFLRGSLALVVACAAACDGGTEAKPSAAAEAKPDGDAASKTDATKKAELNAEPKPVQTPKATPTSAATPKPDAAGAAKVDPKTLLDDEGHYNYAHDAFGDLKDGLADTAVVAKLGEPESKSGREEEGATGDIVDQWNYPKQGVTLTMRSTTMTGAQSIGGLTITAPCEFKTKLGIGIGSTRAEVLAAYGTFKDPEFPARPDQFIAGSVYGGTFFDFTEDKVVSMFMGAGAE